MARRLGFGGIFVVLIAVWLSAAQAPGSGAQRPGGPPPPASELPPPVTDPTGDAFYTAIRTDNAAALGELLKTANVNYVERRGGATPLMHAAAFGSLDTLRLLLDAGANVNAKSYAGATALMWAASQPDKVRLLVERGADVNLASEAGRTALQLAAMSGGSSDTVRLLLSKGANAKAVDKLGQTVLQAAVQGTDFGSITQIVEAGVDVNAADMAAGFSPLILASALGNTNAARLLLGKGARVNTVSSPPGVTVKNGTIALGRFTPLLIASTYGPADLVKLLLDAGADVNARDARGMTPLMMAVAADHGDPEIVRMLIAKGADLNAKSDAGESALDWARKGGATTRTKLLEGAGAQAFAAPAAAVRPAATAAAATPAAIRAAVTRGVTITERVSAGFLASGGCASCHAQNITDVAVAEAKRAGVRVDEAAANERARGSSAQFGSLASRFLEREDGPAAVILMYALLALDAHTHPADRATDALVFNLAAQQASNGSWPTFGNSRAPTADGQIPETALSIKAFAAYGMPGRGAEMKARVSRAAAWLRAAPVTTADDRAFRTLGLKWSGAPADELRRAAQDALATQKADGGFAQHDEMQSDAYATSITLYAALQAGVPTTDARVQKAIAYLVSTQHEDGSWFVRSRAPKFQPYFDSGFPYEHDQWISSMATGWGTAALASVLRNEPGRAAQ
jgi:ankyrin repeat protein